MVFRFTERLSARHGGTIGIGAASASALAWRSAFCTVSGVGW